MVHIRKRTLLYPLLHLLLLAAPAVSVAAQTVDLDRLDSYFATAAADWNVPGMAVAIVKDDAVVFAKGYGVRHLGQGGAVDENTLFAIASNTKAFTSAALALLVDEGSLGWDDRVHDHLPYLELYDPYVTHELRIRDLLSHRSGLGTYSGDLIWYGTRYTAEEVLRRVRYVPQAFPFRTRYGYSNLMFIAAGEVIRAVTGERWDAFVKRRILEPLGMDRTVTSVSDLSSMDNVATPHAEPEGELMPFPWYSWDNAGAAASIISSVSDMAKWIRLQLNGGEFGGNRLFSSEAQQLMWTPHIAIPLSATYRTRYPSTHFRGYGLGWSLSDYLGRKIVSHGGAYDGMFSRVALVPEENLGMVILTNSTTQLPGALMYKILDSYLGGEPRDWSREVLERTPSQRQIVAERKREAESHRAPGTEPSLPLESYAGTYGGEMYGDASVTLEGGSLVVAFEPNPDLIGDLTHWHFDTFVIQWRRPFPWFGGGTVQFLLDAQGKVSEMKIDVPNEDFWFTELEFGRKESLGHN